MQKDIYNMKYARSTKHMHKPAYIRFKNHNYLFIDPKNMKIKPNYSYKIDLHVQNFSQMQT